METEVWVFLKTCNLDENFYFNPMSRGVFLSSSYAGAFWPPIENQLPL